jgi:allantoicase
VLLPQTPLQPHARHRFVELAHWAPATHARLSIYPDGGVARLRLFGRLNVSEPEVPSLSPRGEAV